MSILSKLLNSAGSNHLPVGGAGSAKCLRGICPSGAKFLLAMSGHEKHMRDEMRKLARKLRAAAEESLSYEGTSFKQYAQFLRDVSGLCRKGMLRLAWNSIERGVQQSTIERLKEHPQVEKFLALARSLPVGQLEDLSRLILQEFDEADPDPLRAETQGGNLEPRFGRRERSPAFEEIVEEPLPEALPSRSSGHLRPRTPSRSPKRTTVSKKPLPRPPPAPVASRPFDWQRPWTTIVTELTVLDGDKLWIKCPCEGCGRWFRQPSALKQHLMHKIGQGQHPDSTVFGQLQFDSLWDGTWAQMEKIQKVRMEKAAPLDEKVDESPRTAPVKRSLSPDGDWPADVPKPPKPVAEPEGRKRLKEEGWMEPVPTAVVELMSMAAYLKANQRKLDPEHWYEYIGPISDQLAKDLMKGHEKVACVHLEQVKNHDPVELQLSAGWNAEDIMAYVPSILGMDFTSLGTTWMLTYRGAHVNLVQQWLHFGVVFSPGLTPEGAPLGRAVGIEALPEDVRRLAEVKGVIPLRRTTVEALARLDTSQSSPVVAPPSHGSAAATVERPNATVVGLLKEAKENPMRDKQLAEGRQTDETGQSGAAVKPVQANPVSDSQAAYHDDLAEDLLEAAITAEKNRKMAEENAVKTQAAIMVEKNRKIAEEQALKTQAVSSERTVATTQVDGSSEALPASGNSCDGKGETPESKTERILAKVDAPPEGVIPMEPPSGVTHGGEDVVGHEGDGGAGDRPKGSSAQEELSVTQRFTPDLTVPASELFQLPPEPHDTRVVQQDVDTWARPSRDYMHAAVFVDGKVFSLSESFKVGVLGPKGVGSICVACGEAEPPMFSSCGYPFCHECFVKGDLDAQALLSWRTQVCDCQLLEEAPFFGMSSGMVVGNTPEEVVDQVKCEFEISPLRRCALMKNVRVLVTGLSNFCGRPVVEVATDVEGDVALIAYDEWYSSFWCPAPGDIYWIAKLGFWGKICDVVVHYFTILAVALALQNNPDLIAQGVVDCLSSSQALEDGEVPGEML